MSVSFDPSNVVVIVLLVFAVLKLRKLASDVPDLRKVIVAAHDDQKRWREEDTKIQVQCEAGDEIRKQLDRKLPKDSITAPRRKDYGWKRDEYPVFTFSAHPQREYQYRNVIVVDARYVYAITLYHRGYWHEGSYIGQMKQFTLNDVNEVVKEFLAAHTDVENRMATPLPRGERINPDKV